jgi:hypothetical protein
MRQHRRLVGLRRSPAAALELAFENEKLRQKRIASPARQRVCPPVEKTMTTTKDYPVVLYDEV